jgi:hypothetical protein
MQQREWDKIALHLKPNTRPGDAVILRPGPLISVVAVKPWPQSPPIGALLHGHVYFAEDGRVVVRYTEVQLEGGARVPICFAVVAGDNETFTPMGIGSKTEDSVTVVTGQVANAVQVLPD